MRGLLKRNGELVKGCEPVCPSPVWGAPSSAFPVPAEILTSNRNPDGTYNYPGIKEDLKTNGCSIAPASAGCPGHCIENYNSAEDDYEINLLMVSGVPSAQCARKYTCTNMKDMMSNGGEAETTGASTTTPLDSLAPTGTTSASDADDSTGDDVGTDSGDITGMDPAADTSSYDDASGDDDGYIDGESDNYNTYDDPAYDVDSDDITDDMGSGDYGY